MAATGLMWPLSTSNVAGPNSDGQNVKYTPDFKDLKKICDTSHSNFAHQHPNIWDVVG